MIVISHRGYWRSADEKNTCSAFHRSFDLGFGTETDIRDYKGELVISHDMPLGQEITLDEFLDVLAGRNLPLALNIKSDGLAVVLGRVMRKRQVSDWFVFDMAVPDMRSHFDAGNPVFTRMSDIEPAPAYLNESQGIWLDMFNSQWYDSAVIESLLNRGKRVCIVSSELHGKDPSDLWSSLCAIAHHPRLLLCTDEPELASRYFSTSIKYK
jgi:glycerophosphoryl diester phosphodiesterase